MKLRVVEGPNREFFIERKGLWFWRQLDFEDLIAVDDLPHEDAFGFGIYKWTTPEKAEAAAKRYRDFVRHIRTVVAEVS